jgi:hypothetical protein
MRERYLPCGILVSGMNLLAHGALSELAHAAERCILFAFSRAKHLLCAFAGLAVRREKAGLESEPPYVFFRPPGSCS